MPIVPAIELIYSPDKLLNHLQGFYADKTSRPGKIFFQPGKPKEIPRLLKNPGIDKLSAKSNDRANSD